MCNQIGCTIEPFQNNPHELKKNVKRNKKNYLGANKLIYVFKMNVEDYKMS